MKLCRHLNQSRTADRELSRQLVRSATSIGANVEEAQAAQSRADFISKMSIAQREARETRYWLRVLIGAEVIPEERLNPLLGECVEILRIISSIVVKTKAKG